MLGARVSGADPALNRFVFQQTLLPIRIPSWREGQMHACCEHKFGFGYKFSWPSHFCILCFRLLLISQYIYATISWKVSNQTTFSPTALMHLILSSITSLQ